MYDNCFVQNGINWNIPCSALKYSLEILYYTLQILLPFHAVWAQLESRWYDEHFTLIPPLLHGISHLHQNNLIAQIAITLHHNFQAITLVILKIHNGGLKIYFI